MKKNLFLTFALFFVFPVCDAYSDNTIDQRAADLNNLCLKGLNYNLKEAIENAGLSCRNALERISEFQDAAAYHVFQSELKYGPTTNPVYKSIIHFEFISWPFAIQTLEKLIYTLFEDVNDPDKSNLAQFVENLLYIFTCILLLSLVPTIFIYNTPKKTGLKLFVFLSLFSAMICLVTGSALLFYGGPHIALHHYIVKTIANLTAIFCEDINYIPNPVLETPFAQIFDFITGAFTTIFTIALEIHIQAVANWDFTSIAVPLTNVNVFFLLLIGVVLHMIVVLFFYHTAQFLLFHMLLLPFLPVWIGLIPFKRIRPAFFRFVHFYFHYLIKFGLSCLVIGVALIPITQYMPKLFCMTANFESIVAEQNSSYKANTDFKNPQYEDILKDKYFDSGCDALRDTDGYEDQWRAYASNLTASDDDRQEIGLYESDIFDVLPLEMLIVACLFFLTLIMLEKASTLASPIIRVPMATAPVQMMALIYRLGPALVAMTAARKPGVDATGSQNPLGKGLSGMRIGNDKMLNVTKSSPSDCTSTDD